MFVSGSKYFRISTLMAIMPQQTELRKLGQRSKVLDTKYYAREAIPVLDKCSEKNISLHKVNPN